MTLDSADSLKIRHPLLSRRCTPALPLGVVGAVAVAGLLAGCNNNQAAPLGVCSVATAIPISLAVGQSMALDPTASGGCFGFPATASTADSAEYVMVAQSAAAIPTDSSPFELTGISSAGVAASRAPWRGYRVPPPRSNAARFDAFLHSPDRPWNRPVRADLQRAYRPGPRRVPVNLGTVRSFVVCSGPSCSSTDTIWARAQGLGAHVAIYIDTLTPLPGGLGGFSTNAFDSLLQVLDQRIYPIDIQNFGAVTDIDTNGVVIALFTPVVNQLVTRTDCEANGYIAGFFYAGDLYPGLSQEFNNGEIYYSVVPDPDSTVSCAHSVASIEELTPPTFAHELEHMINFGQHVLMRPTSPGAEEGWLDEGLARYAEELAARSWLPGDTSNFHQYMTFGNLYDAYQYLLDPGESYLLLDFDNGTLAEAGASWLFVDYLVDQYGPNVAGELVQSQFIGPQNVAARTGASWNSVVTDWALANWVSDLPGLSAPSQLRYTTWSFRATYDTLHESSDPVTASRFPDAYPLMPQVVGGSQVLLTGELRSGSGSYVRAAQGPGDAAFAVDFTLNNTTGLGTTIVPRLDIIRTR